MTRSESLIARAFARTDFTMAQRALVAELCAEYRLAVNHAISVEKALHDTIKKIEKTQNNS